MIDLKLLIINGVHFGHQTARWSPKMEPFIWGFKDGIHLIDVMKTARYLEKAAKFLESVAADGKTILFVGTKKAARDEVKKVAEQLNLPYVIHRWVGGTFTNYRQVRKAIANLQSYEEVLKKSSESHFTKKELNLLKKRAGRLDNIVGGIRKLSWPVGAVVVVDVKKESVVVKEANSSGIPVVGLVDTNTDPTDVDYVIPANDDSPRSIGLLINYLGEAVARGQKKAAEKPKKTAATSAIIVETLYDEEPDTGKKRPAKAVAKKPVPKKPAPKAEEKPKVAAKAEEPKAAKPKAASEKPQEKPQEKPAAKAPAKKEEVAVKPDQPKTRTASSTKVKAEAAE